ncbi:SDR family NAD(P)-dependent oxidoreductase [Paracoccus xiamenensis]|uniref:SDR family NAD(P)-dependent oxidoreductase n=1 Tax=Paracoccus xiamenensis TaxID=2714901 RepID=UPI00140E7C57|nr:SDR family NAD(P)-dependent oxidoreductase [Paracoccus xiamenensis]NHF74451.1 SDR family oxidoreductase [Paracoccus xiamenensis]
MTDAKTKTAIVTGAGGGIGRAIARRLAHDGFAVIVADRAQGPADETVALIQAEGRQARAEVLDITDEAATQALIDGADDLRVLVNNAGIFDVKEFDKLTADDFRRMYEVNLVAMATLCQQAARVMPEESRIVNLASRAAFGARNYAHYVASKAGVAGLTKALSLELAPKQITVNAVAPGVIETDMLKARSDSLADMKAQQPTGRLGSPEDIAHAVAFFAHPQASFVTGQVLIVDGGRSVGGTAAF